MMASEIEAVPCNCIMKLVQRSYCTEPGWRLATYKEAYDKLDMIKQQGLLKEWEIARLLDGWISGPRYNFQMEDDFRSCLGYMLLTQVQRSGNSDHARSTYEDVTLSEKGREVALRLCVEDWNYEVVYWLLNFWEKREPFNPLDVREGNIPFSNRTKFEEMNKIICSMGRVLGEERLDSEKVTRRKLSGESVKEVMISMGKSCSDKFIEGQTFLDGLDTISTYLSEDEEFSKVNWFQEFASQGGTSDAFWNFLWYFSSSSLLGETVRLSLSLLFKEWDKEECQTGNRRDFIMSTAILFHLSTYKQSELRMIVKQACDNRQITSLAYCDKSRNYDILNKILIYAVRDEVSVVVNKVLEWGAQPQANLGPDKQNMALYYAVIFDQKEIVRSLFDKCHSKEQFANAANQEGRTALHWVCGADGRWPKVSICRMIVEYGGRPDVPDNRGRLPLHYAVERRNEDTVDLLIGEGNSDTVQNQDFYKRRAEMVTRKDNDGVSPLDMVVKDNNLKLMLKLLSVSQIALDTYFDKLDSAKLLRESASQGDMEVVKKILESGADPLAACDEQGQTALHHACMCEDAYNARMLTELMLEKCTSEEEKKKWVTKQDDMGKTALHVAAMKGHVNLCYLLLDINEGILQIRDTDGRTALFEAVKGGYDYLCLILINREEDSHYDSIVDRSGQTALHVAASEGRMRIANLLLRKSKKSKAYVRKTDVFGQTALHKAAKGGHANIIKILLHWGAHPLLERDCDGRTVLHCVAQTITGEDGKEVAELLLKKCGSDDKKLLFLWASAAGLGTADQHLAESPLRKFLVEQKKNITENLTKAGKENNLLKTAACLGDIDLTKELLTRGAKIEDIKDQKWRNTLSKQKENNVETVSQQIQSIAEQANDQPTTSDNLGRSDFANGLAALLLNPYLKPPITVGISGSWGMGKSSLMVRTEGILLKTAAQLALLPSEMSNSDVPKFPGFQILEHTEKGKKKYHQIETSINLLLDAEHRSTTKSKCNFSQTMKDTIDECWTKIKDKISGKMTKERHSLREFLNVYKSKHHHIFKSLAAMDSSGMFKVEGQQSRLEIDPSTEESVPAILTVRYNAWKYKNESEALAGMAVEITKGMEGIMTDAQWLSTCLRNTWRKQKQVIWIEIIFPCLLAVLLATSFTWILWSLLDRYNIKESMQLKYASFPLTVVIMAWALAKKVMSAVNPVSVQLMNYIKLPDHTEKLGYQERVISDITFLKKEISKKPYCLCTVASYIWDIITGSCIISLLSSKHNGENMTSSIPSANLRTIVFVDDLDRCQESVILQVLSAINLVLAVCEISVVLGMDKELIQRAIMKRHGDKSLKNSRLADKYLQKIIQLPLDLPDPSQVQSKDFLDRHLGVFQKQSKEGHSESEIDTEDDSMPEIDRAYNALFSAFEQSKQYYVPDFLNKMLGSVAPISGEGSSSAEIVDAPPQTQPAGRIAIDIQDTDGTSNQQRISESNIRTEFIPIRELLFVRYSEGERDAFCHFQAKTTDFRKLPREWKRLLTYHRLVWYIFVMNNETKNVDGWQVQLITWIFICWEFEEDINTLVQRWKDIDLLKTYKLESESESESKLKSKSESKSGPGGPSLRAIIDHCIKKWEGDVKENNAKNSKNKEVAGPENLISVVKENNSKLDKALKELQELKELVNSQQVGKSENKDPPTQDLEEATNSQNIEVPESSNKEQMKLKEGVNDQTTSVRDVTKAGDCFESSELAGPENLITANDKLDKALKELDSLKKEMEELKELVNSQQAGKTEKMAGEKKLNLQSWRRLKSALGKYDVSMDGIQAFQRFRFYCEAGHIQWPLRPEEE